MYQILEENARKKENIKKFEEKQAIDEEKKAARDLENDIKNKLRVERASLERKQKERKQSLQLEEERKKAHYRMIQSLNEKIVKMKSEVTIDTNL